MQPHGLVCVDKLVHKANKGFKGNKAYKVYKGKKENKVYKVFEELLENKAKQGLKVKESGKDCGNKIDTITKEIM